jgi:hypothetical protein
MVAEEEEIKHYNWTLVGRAWLYNAHLNLKEAWFTQCVFSCMVSLRVVFILCVFPYPFCL